MKHTPYWVGPAVAWSRLQCRAEAVAAAVVVAVAVAVIRKASVSHSPTELWLFLARWSSLLTPSPPVSHLLKKVQRTGSCWLAARSISGLLRSSCTIAWRPVACLWLCMQLGLSSEGPLHGACSAEGCPSVFVAARKRQSQVVPVGGKVELWAGLARPRGCAHLETRQGDLQCIHVTGLCCRWHFEKCRDCHSLQCCSPRSLPWGCNVGGRAAKGQRHCRGWSLAVVRVSMGCSVLCTVVCGGVYVQLLVLHRSWELLRATAAAFLSLCMCPWHQVILGLYPHPCMACTCLF